MKNKVLLRIYVILHFVQFEPFFILILPTCRVGEQNETRLHSSRMHTARSLTVSPSMLCSGGACLVPGDGACPRGGACLVTGEGVGVVPAWSRVCVYGIPACTEADTPCGQNSWHTLLKILPCPKLRLRAVTKWNGPLCVTYSCDQFGALVLGIL